MKEGKKAWMEPELIVLTRSEPEEAVLTGCKGSWGNSTAGNAGGNNGCMTSGCGICWELGTS